MKYWKGKPGTVKEGEIGSMDDDGYVPDSEPATLEEYTSWLGSIPKQAEIVTPIQTDISALTFSSLAEAEVKLKDLLERLRKNEK